MTGFRGGRRGDCLPQGRAPSVKVGRERPLLHRRRFDVSRWPRRIRSDYRYPDVYPIHHSRYWLNPERGRHNEYPKEQHYDRASGKHLAFGLIIRAHGNFRCVMMLLRHSFWPHQCIPDKTSVVHPRRNVRHWAVTKVMRRSGAAKVSCPPGRESGL